MLWSIIWMFDGFVKLVIFGGNRLPFFAGMKGKVTFPKTSRSTAI
jgi:hypothetical protein